MVDFTPSYYSVAGTPLVSRRVLQGVIAGSVYHTVYNLALAPKTATISWGWEPYSVLQTPDQLKCLKLVLDDPRFAFDAEFACACSYFTPTRLRKLIWTHSRAQRWVRDPEAFRAEAHNCYLSRTGTTNLGLDHRVYHGYQECQLYNMHYQRAQRWRLAFILYPALKFWVQRRLEEFYMPGGKGFLTGKERFEAAAAEATKLPAPTTPLELSATA